MRRAVNNNKSSTRVTPKLKSPAAKGRGISKAPTGIEGLDEITRGGLPRGRPTLICGSAGAGKTLLGLQFLVQGAIRFDEPGVCISFEETAAELTANVASLGIDVGDLIARKKIAIDHVHVDPGEVEEAGEFDLEALFVRLGLAVDTVGAKRVLIDCIEALFSGLPNPIIIRNELRRLFRWLKSRNLTAVITGERSRDGLTRHGIEEYVSDCVIMLDHRLVESISTRHLRVVKYRGSAHATNEFPFLIDEDGISVLPLTSLALDHSVSSEQVSTGLPDLDAMFNGNGYFRGSSVLVSGTAGTGKTSLVSHFVDAACSRGERCLFFSFEESAPQVVRNMRSIGLDLGRWIGKGLLKFHSVRPTSFGLEMHLVKFHQLITALGPSIVVIDPVTALLQSGTRTEARSMMLRLVDYLKGKHVTTLMTTLTHGNEPLEQSQAEISSLVDVWMQVRDMESGGERNRCLFVLKARGLAHSNQIREFLLTDHGVRLRDVYLGEAGLLTGSARVSQEARDTTAALATRQRIEAQQAALERKQQLVDAQIAALRVQAELDEQEARLQIAQEQSRLDKSQLDRGAMAESRPLRDRGAGAARRSRYVAKGGGGK
jgi:circadian clock protein KaiC